LTKEKRNKNFFGMEGAERRNNLTFAHTQRKKNDVPCVSDEGNKVGD